MNADADSVEGIAREIRRMGVSPMPLCKPTPGETPVRRDGRPTPRDFRGSALEIDGLPLIFHLRASAFICG